MKEVNNFVNKSDGRIMLHSLVGEEEIGKILVSSNVLVNISNASNSFKPNKISNILRRVNLLLICIKMVLKMSY